MRHVPIRNRPGASPRARFGRTSAAALAVIVALGLVAAGCGSSGSKSTSAPASTASSSGKHYRMALVAAFPIAGNPFYLTLECTAKAQARQLGVDLTEANPAVADVQHELPLLQAAIAAKPDVIILASIDRTALAATVHQAMQQGIKFVYVDQLPDDQSGAISVLQYNIENVGVKNAKILAQAMGNKGTAIAVSLQPGIPTFDAINKGFTAGLKGTGVTLKDTIYGGNSAQDAEAKVSAALTGDPSITGIDAFINNQADGTLAALRQLGRTDVKVVSNYVNYEQLGELTSGRLLALEGLPAGPLGSASVQQAYDALTGKPVTKHVVSPTFTITKDNVNSAAAKPYLYPKTCNA